MSDYIFRNCNFSWFVKTDFGILGKLGCSTNQVMHEKAVVKTRFRNPIGVSLRSLRN